MKVDESDFPQQYVHERTFRNFFPSALSSLTDNDLCNVTVVSHFFDDFGGRSFFIILDNEFFYIKFLGKFFPSLDIF